jgi:hypothetical protein
MEMTTLVAALASGQLGEHNIWGKHTNFGKRYYSCGRIAFLFAYSSCIQAVVLRGVPSAVAAAAAAAAGDAVDVRACV